MSVGHSRSMKDGLCQHICAVEFVGKPLQLHLSVTCWRVSIGCMARVDLQQLVAGPQWCMYVADVGLHADDMADALLLLSHGSGPEHPVRSQPHTPLGASLTHWTCTELYWIRGSPRPSTLIIALTLANHLNATQHCLSLVSSWGTQSAVIAPVGLPMLHSEVQNTHWQNAYCGVAQHNVIMNHSQALRTMASI